MPLLSSEGPRPKVLVPEKLSPDGLALLRASTDVHEKMGLAPEELLTIISDYDALVVRSETKVTDEVLQTAKKLKVVARAGVGVDNVDVDTATKLGIVVVNSPAGNVGAAAEHTIALMMGTARKISHACSSLKGDKWERSKFVGVEVKGKTLGIIGLGKVGMIVARLAKGLGMNVNAMDPYASEAVASSASITLVSSLSELLPTVDFLTIHTPLIASTKARGGTIDEIALLDALESGHIAGAGIDVFTSEPRSSASRIIAHTNVGATPHLGASTEESQEKVSIDGCEQGLQILGGALPRSAVNAPLILPEEYKKLQPFVRLVEKMGSLYTQHYSSSTSFDANRSTFDLIYEGDIAGINNTKPLFAAFIKGLMATISSTNVSIVNAELVARERGIVVNEQRSRDPSTHSYSSLVTLVARPPSRAPSRAPGVAETQRPLQNPHQQIISGTCSGSQIIISRLGRFATSFVPEGRLLICHNYDSPGKIGVVGSILGKEDVNINFMSVAPISKQLLEENAAKGQNGGNGNGIHTEALMLLGVDGPVSQDVVTALVDSGGVLSASLVSL
ncbi:D-3-phosphoglycerate dehydrogenase [Coccidioides immitis RMSCC 3703]|uniref:phosphoglycerate dehydrogenase n=1 Tax=Coccidioides immitis RMSCC 3703 TaxID=454286 RepID=A0A0J8QSM3_COCIT|nr:D-3-phosphoglycerate dehydrogenase [Coccidioides immitis RMSCC 3703]